MRFAAKEYVRRFAKQGPVLRPIYEFGAYQVKGQERWADLRPFFPGKQYVGADIRRGTGVDVLLDLCALNLPDASVGTAICVDTLEHVRDPVQACKEITRILRPGGAVVLTTCFNFPVHNCPHDYWRFTPDAMRLLFPDLVSMEVTSDGDEAFPCGVYFKGRKPTERQLELDMP